MKGYLRYVLLLLAVMAAAPQVAAAGCGKDCRKDGAGQQPASGCRVVYGSGILYDNGAAIAVSAPAGWVLDTESGAASGYYAVFYPEGSSWSGSDTVMYAKIVHKCGCKNATIEKLIVEDTYGPSEPGAGLRVADGGILSTSKGKGARLVIYDGAAHKAIAYVDEEKVITRLVITSKTSEGLEGAMPAFREFVGTYLFVSDDVNAGENCKSGKPGTAAVREVEGEGEVGSVDKAGGVIIFRPDGAQTDVAVHADDSLGSGLKTGDRVRVAYTEGEINTATKLIKLHKISRMPKACILSH